MAVGCVLGEKSQRGQGGVKMAKNNVLQREEAAGRGRRATAMYGTRRIKVNGEFVADD